MVLIPGSPQSPQHRQQVYLQAMAKSALQIEIDDIIF